jgi:5-methylcytosine-specific restriction endonuclease McrA
MGGSPTSGHTGYRRLKALVLAASDECGICHHGGSLTVDHIVSHRDWPPGVPGLDDIDNLQPAHGTMTNQHQRINNPCPTCGRLCNQSKGGRRLPPATSPRSRHW